MIDQERKDNIITNYTKDASLPFVDIEVRNDILDDSASPRIRPALNLRRCTPIPPTKPNSKRERWTASVTYVFRESVQNNELAVNPLGLAIVRFRADQAFD